MPHARHHLDLHLLVTPADRGLEADQAGAWWDLGVAQGWWTEAGRAGPAAEALVEGGFAAAELQRFDRVRFVANQQGGFRVTCPQCQRPLAGPFGHAVQTWREGGARSMTCPACGWHAPLEEVPLRPPGGFARAWLLLTDVGTASVTPEARAEMERWTGALAVVARRPG